MFKGNRNACGCQFIIKYFDPSLPQSNSFFHSIHYSKNISNGTMLFLTMHFNRRIILFKYLNSHINFETLISRIRKNVFINFKSGTFYPTISFQMMNCHFLGHNMYLVYRSIKIFISHLTLRYMLRSDKIETK